jgi:hypothetical protein
VLRKQILTRDSTMSRPSAAEKDIAALATVLVSSEDPDHPIDFAFDGQRGPGQVAGLPNSRGNRR